MRKPVLKQPLFALMTPKPLKLPQPAYLAASGKMMLAATQPAGLSFDTRCFPRFLCLGRQRPSLAAQCYFPRSSLAFCASGGRGLHWRLSAYAVDRPRGHDARHLSTA